MHPKKPASAFQRLARLQSVVTNRLSWHKVRVVIAESRKRVYVVDDEPVIATTLGLIFRQAGFDSSVYNDPLLALEACGVAAPDAIVSDVMMPNMTGIDLALRVGQLYPACRVILMSGQAATSDLVQAATQQGYAFDVLGKPVPPATLVERLRTVLS